MQRRGHRNRSSDALPDSSSRGRDGRTAARVEKIIEKVEVNSYKIVPPYQTTRGGNFEGYPLKHIVKIKGYSVVPISSNTDRSCKSHWCQSHNRHNVNRCGPRFHTKLSHRNKRREIMNKK